MPSPQPHSSGSNPASRAPQEPWKACIRILQSSQLYQFQWHLLRLEDAGRRSRFGCPASDEFVRAYGENAGSDRIVLGCFVDGHMRGAVELEYLRAGWRKRAEMAFSVEEPWRGRGIGKALMAAAVRAARADNIVRLYLSCHALNRRMQALAEGAGARLDFEGCECFAEIDVAAEPAETGLAA